MEKKRSNKKFILGLAVAFLLPLSFYFITRALSKDKLHMPRYYGVDSVLSHTVNGKIQNDTVFHLVSNLSLTNQLGDKISLDSTLKGKILVIDFFFINCPSVCPRLTGNMGMLQKAFLKNPRMETSLENDVQFISITVDPSRDSFPAMRAYADRHSANLDHWWFLTGDKKAIYGFARNDLRLATGDGDGGADDFIHTEKLTLIDVERHIRGYYDGLDTLSIRKCADDIVLLTLEKEKTAH